MHRIGSACLPLLVLLFICWSGCDSNRMRGEFADQAFSKPSNYTHTDASGQIIEDTNGQPLTDADDWRVGPGLPGPAIGVDPAYPNPVGRDGKVYLRLSIRFNDIDLGGFLTLAEPRDMRTLSEIQTIEVSGVGVYLFSFPAALLGTTGLHRLVVVSGRGEIVTYGDVFVQ